MKPSLSTQGSKESRFKNNTSVAAISNCQTDTYLKWRATNTSFSALSKNKWLICAELISKQPPQKEKENQ